MVTVLSSHRKLISVAVIVVFLLLLILQEGSQSIVRGRRRESQSASADGVSSAVIRGHSRSLITTTTTAKIRYTLCTRSAKKWPIGGRGEEKVRGWNSEIAVVLGPRSHDCSSCCDSDGPQTGLQEQRRLQEKPPPAPYWRCVDAALSRAIPTAAIGPKRR